MQSLKIIVLKNFKLLESAKYTKQDILLSTQAANHGINVSWLYKQMWLSSHIAIATNTRESPPPK